MDAKIDIITPQEAGSLAGLFHERVQRSPALTAYRYYDTENNSWMSYSWKEMASEVSRWKAALEKENLAPGDRVALMLRNCPQWVMYDQAALAAGLVVVPLYTNDRAENVGYIVEDAEIKVLLFETEEQWQSLKTAREHFASVQRFISLNDVTDGDEGRLVSVKSWLPAQAPPLTRPAIDGNTLASIVYTSGTTGQAKGVMLSHNNILFNAYDAVSCEVFSTADQFLSFLPLSHMFERTAGYYMSMLSGSTTNYARSIEKLAEDLTIIKPTVLVTVPRIFERVYNKIHDQLAQKSPVAQKLFAATVNVGWHRFLLRQKKAYWHPKLLLWPLLNALVARKIMAKLGGHMRLAVSGGAPLTFNIARTFIALGLEISQGYGMTEAAPVVSTNRLYDNDPASVGQVLPEIEVKLGAKDELLVKGPNIMMGYWNNEQASKEVIDADGWLHTGDIARIENEHIYITGRIKEIIVLATGEKVPPTELELAIATDSLFEQVMVIGETKPYLSAITVLNPEHWHKLARTMGIDADDLDSLNSERAKEVISERIAKQLHAFPGYAKIVKLYSTLEPWTTENGLITPTLKIKRNKVMEHFLEQIEAMYAGH